MPKLQLWGGQLLDPLLGIQAQNPGFEIPMGLNANPVEWEDMAANNVVKTGPGLDKARSGFLAIGLPLGTTYYSKISTTTYNGDYVVSTWVNNENGGYGECRLMDNNGVNFAPAIFISSMTTGTTGWTHITSSANMAVNTPFKFRLTHPWGNSWYKKWHDYSSTTNPYYIYGYDSKFKLGVLQNHLYMTMYIIPGGGGTYIWRRYNGNNWLDIPTTGLPATYPDSYAPFNLQEGIDTIYNGKVYSYVSQSPMTKLWGFDGNSWTPTNSYPGEFFANSMVYCYAVFKGNLYVGGYYKVVVIGYCSVLIYAKIWKYNGTAISTSYYDALGSCVGGIRRLCVYSKTDRLYANDITGIISTADGISWSPYDLNFQIIAGGGGQSVGSMCVYNDRLYVGVGYDILSGKKSRLFFYDGVSWQAGPVLNEIGARITAMAVYKGKLYIGTGAYGNSNVAGKIYVYDGINCDLDYSLNLSNDTQIINSFAEFRGLLYANYYVRFPTMVLETGILQLGGYSLFDDVSLSPRQVIFSSSTVVSPDTDYEYYTSKGSDSDDFTRFKRYRLHYDRPARKLYRQRYKGPGPNDWEDLSPAPLCENVSKLTITNRNQESFEVELILEKSYDAGSNKKTYKMNSKFTPAVP